MNIKIDEIRKQTIWLDMSSQLGLLQLTGKDRETFLDALCSNDIKALPVNCGQRNALLDKQSNILYDFRLFKTAESLFLLARVEQIFSLRQCLEGYLFAEQVHMNDLSGSYRLPAIQGGDARSLVNRYMSEERRHVEISNNGIHENQLNHPVRWIFSHSITGDPGFLLAVSVASIDNIIETLNPIPRKEWQELETQRIESGYLEYGKDFDRKTMLLMLNLDDKILCRSKGCFPGQEMVARILSRSEIKQKLMGLRLTGTEKFRAGQTIKIAGKPVGTIKRAAYSPLFEQTLAIAMLVKSEAVDQKIITFQVGEKDYQATVVKLPFYVSPDISNRARKVYDEGMVFYHSSLYDEAIQQFDQALAIYPDFSDAVEAKAMTLEKSGRIDEAILLNQLFTRKDPNAVMAHTNLSRLYMLKGWKDKAEKELSQATMLRWRKIATKNGSDEAQLLKQKDDAQRAAMDRKLNMFKQVLKLDPDDEVANFGYGKIQLESGEYQEAEIAFKKVLQANADYSAAYELLVKSLRAQDKIDQARNYAAIGIDVAEGQGNLMPANSMRQMLLEMG